MLRFFFIALLLLVLLLLGGPALLLVAAIQPQPLVTEEGGVRHDDVGRIKALLQQHDPRQLKDGEIRRLQVSERDLNLILDSVLPYSQQQRAQVALGAGRGQLNYTLALPGAQGKFLNVSAALQEDGQRLALQELRFGATPVPGWLLAPLVGIADDYLRARSAEFRDVMTALQEVRIQPQYLQLAYQWQSDLAERIQSSGRDLLLPEQERQRVLAYYSEIARLSQSLGRGEVALDRMLQPLFELALERSAGGGDPAGENRALLLALGVALSGKSIEHLVGRPEGAELPSPRPLYLVLRGRDDLAKHFGISAAITAAGGGALADTIGVFKEVDDSRGGSGFSFADLLADRAGVSLAEAAMGKNAPAVQQFMSRQLQESGYMPDITRLPEGVMELEFKSRFEDLDSASYALVQGEIERRIGNCALYRPGS
ncbi:MAG: hypothetical protein KA159_04170 [Halioglobus sp.]|nr:hypothetical protein [Halioglobus sp.]